MQDKIQHVKQQDLKLLYESKLDDEEIRESLGEEKVSEENVRLAGKVHTSNEILNMDFTLAVTDEKLEEWMNKQALLAHRTYEFMIDKDKKWAIKTKYILMQEIINRLIFTRSRNGRVLKAFLTGGEKEEEAERKLNALQKLFNTKKREQQEE